MAQETRGGLAGVIAGDTAIATIGHEGAGLTYRGYAIEDLVEHATFEEVAYLLLHGEAPTANALRAFQERLRGLRELPPPIKATLEAIPATAHPMDVLRTGCSMLGNLEPEHDFSAQQEAAYRLLAAFPSMIAYWHHFHVSGRQIASQTNEETTAGHILHLLNDRAPCELHRKALDVSLILYAEHEFNASTFAARVIAATLADLHSAVAGAIGALRGPLHGGANEGAMALIERFDTPGQAVEGVKAMLARKERIMGFGHRVYVSTADPRNGINKRWSRRLAEDAGDMHLYEISEAIERVMWEEKRLFANADFYTASMYHLLGIPTYLFTPMFACSRITGWAAHVFEQRQTNKLIRPNARYVGPPPRAWRPLPQRG